MYFEDCRAHKLLKASWNFAKDLMGYDPNRIKTLDLLTCFYMDNEDQELSLKKGFEFSFHEYGLIIKEYKKLSSIKQRKYFDLINHLNESIVVYGFNFASQFVANRV